MDWLIVAIVVLAAVAFGILKILEQPQQARIKKWRAWMQKKNSPKAQRWSRSQYTESDNVYTPPVVDFREQYLQSLPEYAATEEGLRSAMARGQRMMAISIYMKVYGGTLQNAQDTVDRMMAEAGTQYSMTEEGLRFAISQGDRMRAISIYMKVYGGTLQNAKDTVDRMLAEADTQK